MAPGVKMTPFIHLASRVKYMERFLRFPPYIFVGWSLNMDNFMFGFQNSTNWFMS